MPRGFTEREYQFYKEKLLSVGERLFSLQGLKNVSIDKITREVGIAKGSFYKFYNNKEELCYDCLMLVEKRVKKDLENSVLKECDTTGKLISKILHTIPVIIRNNPLLAIFQDQREMESLMVKVHPDKHKENLSGDMLYFNQLFEGSGVKDEEMIKGLISLFWSFVLLSFNKDFVIEESKPLFSLMDKLILNYFDNPSD